jgi:hypothetical protein
MISPTPLHHQVAQFLLSEYHRIDVDLPQVFSGVSLDLRAVRESAAAVAGPRAR